jgi:hypothetical protein
MCVYVYYVYVCVCVYVRVYISVCVCVCVCVWCLVEHEKNVSLFTFIKLTVDCTEIRYLFKRCAVINNWKR